MSASWAIGACQLLLVAVLWGVTNPALNRTSKSQEAASTTPSDQADIASEQSGATTSSSSASVSSSSSTSLRSLLLNWRFLLAFGLNQVGSVLYLHCLGQLPVSFAVPTVNALAMVITAATAHAMGEKQKINKRVVFGLLLMVCGVSLCVLSQHWQQAAEARDLEANAAIIVTTPAAAVVS